MDTQNTNIINNDVETMTARANTIFNAINTIVGEMADQDRMRVEDLAKKVSKTVSLDIKEVLGYVNDFGKKASVGYITRGANGGYVKGQRPVKTVKAGKKSKKID